MRCGCWSRWTDALSTTSIRPRNMQRLWRRSTPISSTETKMQLKIQYYALMREQAGRSEETLETSSVTPADLYGELTARYGFTLVREQLKVAVNSEFSDWSRRLAAGDAVVFIPPVAGGWVTFALPTTPSPLPKRGAN